MTTLRTLCRITCAAVVSWGWGGQAVAQSVIDPGQGPVPLEVAVGNPGGLSGLTSTGGNTFRYVRNSGGQGAYALVGFNGSTGAINTSSVGLSSPYTYNGGVDMEGIASDPFDGGVFVSDESDHSIRKFPAAGGVSSGSTVVPAIYSQARTNRSLEALSMQANGQSLWAANKDALIPDGNDSPDWQPRVVTIDQAARSIEIAEAEQRCAASGGVEEVHT